MKTSWTCKYSPPWNINIPLLGLGFVEWKGIFCQTVPENSLVSFSLLRLSFCPLAADSGKHRECSNLPSGGARAGIQPETWAQGEGLELGIPWVGVSLFGIKGGAAGPDQPDILDLRIYSRFRNRT